MQAETVVFQTATEPARKPLPVMHPEISAENETSTIMLFSEQFRSKNRIL